VFRNLAPLPYLASVLIRIVHGDLRGFVLTETYVGLDPAA
jgi:hypothetical protein